MQVTAKQIRQRRIHTYTLWDGEMLAHVYRSQGVYDFWSAAIVIERMNDPIEVRKYDGYEGEMWANKDLMDAWIAEQLTELSTGKKLAAGTECEVDGLLGR